QGRRSTDLRSRRPGHHRRRPQGPPQTHRRPQQPLTERPSPEPGPMYDSDAIDLALLVFRVGVGAVMLAHGVNHIIGGGKIAGTAGWFGSLGMRPPVLQAWLASLTEIGAGLLLVLGVLTPFGGAGVVGVMAVAWAIN